MRLAISSGFAKRGQPIPACFMRLSIWGPCRHSAAMMAPRSTFAPGRAVAAHRCAGQVALRATALCEDPLPVGDAAAGIDELPHPQVAQKLAHLFGT